MHDGAFSYLLTGIQAAICQGIFGGLGLHLHL